MTTERRRLRWSRSPPLWLRDAYNLLIDTAKIRLASAFTSMAAVALIVAARNDAFLAQWVKAQQVDELRLRSCPEQDFRLCSLTNESVRAAGRRFISSLT